MVSGPPFAIAQVTPHPWEDEHEVGAFVRSLAEGLAARGHRVRRRPSWSDEFGHAHLIAVEDDHLAGAADPRTGSGSASGW
jgi:gamma-glutamyltranspeptidase